MKQRRGYRGFAALIASMGLVLAGCAIELPQVQADPEPTTTPPVLSDEQLTNILAEVQETLAAADEEKDPDALGDRIVNPAAALRKAEYRLVAATAEEETPVTLRPLSTSSQVSVVAATDTWPRSVLVLSDIPDGTNTPLLLGLRQTEPRAPYALFHWSLMMPGAEFPAFYTAEVGVNLLADDDASLEVSPAQAVEQYVDVIVQGSESEYDEKFGSDVLRDLMMEELETFKENTEDAGTVKLDAKPAKLMATFQTADGGGLVLGQFSSTQTFERTVSGSKMNVGGVLAALNDGEGEVEDKFIATYAHTVALFIPPAGSSEKIEVLAGERVLSSVKTESE